MKPFKERAREEAVKYAHDNGALMGIPFDPNQGQMYGAFQSGAEWAYRQAVEELRKKPYEGSWTEVKEAGQMADWLLEKAGMEDKK